MSPSPPSIAFDDEQRIAALRRLHLLDTEPEPFFDDLIELLQRICAAPIALVSLTDTDRQWFKARRGIDTQELPRRGSLCAHVVDSQRTFIVNDLAIDPLFHENSLVTGPAGIRAYAGAPIFIEGGHVIGTVCALDRVPREWGAHEASHLERAARMVASHAQARAFHAELAVHNSLIEERESAANRQRAIISAMSEGVVVHAADGSILECNRAACEILGLSEDQLRGRTSLDPRWQALDESGAALAGKDHPAMRALASGEPQNRVMISVERPDHDRRFLFVTAIPISGGSLPADRQVLATFVDVTDQVAQQRQLSDLLLRAEEANRKKTEFLAAMSHEIRTPLNGLLGVAQHLARKVSDPALLTSIELLRSSGMALKDIVDDALDIDAIEAGALRLRRGAFSPSQVITETIAVYEPGARVKDLDLAVVSDIPADTLIEGDAGRIKQVLHNLLSNAVKFTDHGRIHLHATLEKRTDACSMLCIEVADTGRGISPQFVDTMFAKFVRAAGAEEEAAGAGLGLYLSLRLARLMGGDLTYKPNSPAGSVFRFEAPAPPAHAPEVSSQLTSVRPDRGMRVLVAEDHQVNRQIFSLLLEPFEMTASFVGNGIEALESAKTDNFDLILMDRHMPGLNGVEVTRQLRAWQSKNGRVRTPIIFVTADGTPAAMIEAEEAGADGYIVKPIVVSVLASEISRVMAQH